MKEKLLKNKWLVATIALAVVAIAAIVVAIVLGVSGPSSDDGDRVFGVGEEGVYYYEVVDGKVVLTLRDGTFTLSGKINKTGVYSVDGNTISLDFFKDEDGTATATLDGETISLVLENATLSFLKETEYTVTFNANGGSEISAVKVINGKTVSKPAVDPIKANSVFVGWYADEALTTPFAFGETAIKSDVTVYAKWAERVAGMPDYTVSFDLGYEGAEEIAPMIAVSGVCYGIPTPERQGYTFGGWWISMAEDGNKLTYIYKEGNVFTKDTVLYAVWHDASSDKLNAPAVSVAGNLISWDAVDGAVSYKVTVIAPDGAAVLDNETVTGTSKEFMFDEKDAGEYKISVVAVAGTPDKNSESADRYFANKTLDKVTGFFVENGILVFGAVENAEKYVIHIVCGNANHEHTGFDNGTSTVYYLAGCQMKEGGIEITVTASAKGYASSVSHVFTYDKTLGAVENLVYNEETDKFTWSPVLGATGYQVTVTVGDKVYTFDNGTVTSFSAAPYTGDVKISVVPTNEGYNSPAAATASCKKTAPAAPTGLAVLGNVLSWTAVEGTGITYEVSVGSQTVKCDTTSLDVAKASLGLIQGQIYEVKVKAINGNGESSSYSETVEIGYFVMNPELTYAKNTVYWTPVLGVENYEVRVNGGEAIAVNGVSNAKVTLTKEGENLIEVRYSYDGKFSDWASVTVTAYAVEYDTRTVTNGVLTVEYLAVGDVMTLPTEGFTYAGYDFTGWSNSPKGSYGNGKIYGEGSVFTGNSYTVLYAEWSPKTYHATLNLDGVNFTITNLVNGAKEPIVYTKHFQLTVPAAQNTGMYYFAGWYTGTAGTGTQITDAEGKSLVPYDLTRDITLYPYYSTNALNFTLQEDGTYAVSKGETIKDVVHLKIPATYNEIPVTVILESGFSSCTTVRTIEIPDTIRLVGTNALNGFTNLEEIKVYVGNPDEAGKYETFYSSVDGALLREDMGTTWLEAFPRAKTGEYTIPAEVEKILPKAFYLAKISKLTIPKTINDLPDYTVYGCTQLETIVFEGGRTTPITFTKNSFYFPSYNSVIKSITLPAMMDVDFAALKGTLNYMSQLTAIHVEDGGTSIASVGGMVTDAEKKTILYCPRGYANELSIPNGITAIGASAFEYCDFITEVTIPVWVTEIGKNAFQYCDGIRTVTFAGKRSENLHIGENAFWCLYSLETVTFEGNGTGELDQGQITMDRLAFYGSSSSSKLHTVTIGDGVNLAGIANQAFQTHSKLTNFNISDKAYVGFIGEKAFEKNLSLTSFKVPATVTSIAKNAFNGCVKLVNLEFATAEGEPELTIESLAFNGCTAIKTVELPDRLKAFDASSFEGCTALKSITVTTTNTKYVADANGILYNKNVDANNNVIYDQLLFYPKALVKENNGVINNLPDTLVTIGGSAFSDNAHLKSIVIPAKVTSIGASAFANCENLTTVQFNAAAATDGEEMTLTIGNSAFYNCKALTDEFRLPSYTTSIGELAFQGCRFTKFVIPEGVTYIGKAAFWGMDTLTEVEFKCTGELTIADGSANNGTNGGAFASCTALKRIDLPAGLVELGNYTFYKSTGLEVVNIGKITITDGVVSVDSKLKNIGNRAFEQCVGLKQIIIPKSVEAIGTSAFAATEKVTASNPGPGSLTDVIFEAGGTAYLNLASNVFWYQPNLEVLNLPERVRIPTHSNFAVKESGKTVSDLNGNTVYNAPTTSATVGISMPSSLFKGCTELAQINIVDDPGYEGLYASVDGVLYDADKTVLIFCPFANVGAYKNGAPTYELTVPNTVELVLNYAMKNCHKLKTVTFEEFDKTDAKYGTQILTVGNYTNSSASATDYMAIGGPESSITKISLPSHLKKIGYNAFTMSSTPQDLEPMEILFNLDASDIAIEKYAFYCSTVKALALPEVKTLGNYAFANCKHMESCTFESFAATKLPDSAFENAIVLKSFEIPASVTELGVKVFNGCAALTQIEIPTKVTKLGNYAFQNSGLTSITLHSGLSFKSVSTTTYLFNGCASLETVTFLPNASGTYSVTQIPNYMFSGCTALKNINLYDFADKITQIGTSAFYKCGNMPATDFTKFTSLTKLAGNAFSYNPNFTRVDLSKTKVTDFGTAFNNNANLAEFIYPETLSTETNTGAFTNCPNLSRVVLTKSFKSAWMANVNSRIIDKSSVPVEIVIPAENTNFSVDEYGVVYDPGKQVIYFANPAADLSKYQIPDTVLTIGKNAFLGNKSLTTLVIPEGVTEIGISAFEETGLTTVVIPASVTLIDDYAFGHAPLKSFVITDTIEMPSQLTTLGSAVFRYSGIESIVLPDKLETLENSMFLECDSLKSITLGASMTAIPNGFAAQANALEEINAQEGIETINWIFSSYSYKGAYGGNKITSFHIPASVKTIHSNAFCDMNNLKTVTIAEGSALEIIKDHAFENCVALETVEGIPAGLATIEKHAFKNCKSLKELDLSATGVTAILEYTFYNTESMTKFGFPANLTTIDTYAFYNTAIENVTLPATVTDLGISAFENADVVTLTFPKNSAMTSLGAMTDSSNKDVTANVFRGTDKLETVVLPNGLQIIARGAFENSSVKTVRMAEDEVACNLTTVGDAAFANCGNLTGFAYLDQVTEIGDEAFFLCTNLENTVVSDKLTDLGSMAFAFCTKLTDAYIPASVLNMGGNPYAGIDVSKLRLADKNNYFMIETDANGVTTLSNEEQTAIYAVYGLTGAYTIPESSKTYMPGALAGNAFTAVTVPATMTEIPDGMFMNCENLTSVTIPEGVTTIGRYAFYGTGLTTVEIPAGVTTIGDCAFMYCEAIDNVVMPKTVVTMGNYLFAYCSNLSNFEFESFEEGETVKVQKIGTHFFYNCKKITQVVLPDKLNISDADKAAVGITSATDIPSYMFAGTGIVHAEIPKNGVSFYFLTEGVFADCKELVSVYIEEAPDNSVTSYGFSNPSIFDGCDKLEGIYIDTLDKAGYIAADLCKMPVPLYVKLSVKDENSNALNSTAYFHYAHNEEFELHFAADTYTDLVEYFDGLSNSWCFQVYDKDGNRLYCSENDGSIAYVEDVNGNVIWGTKPAN